MKRGSQRNSSEDLTPCAAHGRHWHRQVSDGRKDCSSELSRETEPAKCVCVCVIVRVGHIQSVEGLKSEDLRFPLKEEILPLD